MAKAKSFIASFAIIALLISPLAYTAANDSMDHKASAVKMNAADPGGWIGG